MRTIRYQKIAQNWKIAASFAGIVVLIGGYSFYRHKKAQRQRAQLISAIQTGVIFPHNSPLQPGPSGATQLPTATQKSPADPAQAQRASTAQKFQAEVDRYLKNDLHLSNKQLAQVFEFRKEYGRELAHALGAKPVNPNALKLLQMKRHFYLRGLMGDESFKKFMTFEMKLAKDFQAQTKKQ